ncbi:MAG: XisI protein [Saprospiraceae bacterium]
MDKLLKYKNIVRELAEFIAAISPSSKDVEVQKIIDDANGHYLLFSVGWENNRWVYASFVHIDVKESGRVWLQHDGTDLRIADELVNRGIPKSDIVIGFQAPHARKLMEEYAEI